MNVVVAAERRRPLALAAFVSAVLFGIGLVVAGMTTPGKVVGFLDVGGRWDPSLAFVMLGAIAVHAIAHRFIRRWSAPLFGSAFHLPTRRDVDARLLLGAALFGVGWGLSGICPGPGLVAVVHGGLVGARPLLVFIAAMVVGMKLFGLLDMVTKPRPSHNTTPSAT